MNIVAYNNAKVNVFCGNAAKTNSSENSIILQNFNENCAKRFDKFIEKKENAVKISNKLLAIGEKKRGYLMKACNTEMQVYTCKCCGKAKIVNAHLCRDRLCPVCSYLLSIKRYNQMNRTINNIKDKDNYSWRFVTLTIKNCAPDFIEDTIKRMLAAWDKLCKRRALKRAIKGWGRSIEVTYNENTGEFHPHIHIIIAFDKTEYIPTSLELRELWKESLSLDYLPICDIREPYSKDNLDSLSSAILEGFKYALKSKDLVDMPLNSFRSFVYAIKGVRLIAFGGIIRKARQELGIIENDEAEQEIEEAAICCGQNMSRAIARWSFESKTYDIIEMLGEDDNA